MREQHHNHVFAFRVDRLQREQGFLTFEQFQATMQIVPDLSKVDDLSGLGFEPNTPGILYDGSLFIETRTDAWKCSERYHLIMFNESIVSDDLELLERELYWFAGYEGMLSKQARPADAPTPSANRDFEAELKAARAAQDWDAHSRIWEERRMADVARDESMLRHAPAQIVITHPIVGLLSFTSADAAADAAFDIGEAFDLNEIGTLKSRVTICHGEA